MTNIMLDLETLGTKSDSVILSIGAAAFNEDSIINEFYTTINVQSCVEKGLKMYPDTVCWWANQSDAAKKGIFESRSLSQPPFQTFRSGLGQWRQICLILLGCGETERTSTMSVLREAYLKVGHPTLSHSMAF